MFTWLSLQQDEEETEEEEGDKILKQVLDEIGVSVGQQVRLRSYKSAFDRPGIFMLSDVFYQLGEAPSALGTAPERVSESRQPVAIGESSGGGSVPPPSAGNGAVGGDFDDLQARLDNLRKD